ncbi:MAG: diguanylate cyclase [Kiritimatiellia bacterium]
MQTENNQPEHVLPTGIIHPPHFPASAPCVLVVGREMTDLVHANLPDWSAHNVLCVQTGAEGLCELLHHRYGIALVSATLPDLAASVFLEALSLLSPDLIFVTTASLPAALTRSSLDPVRQHLQFQPPLTSALLLTTVSRLLADSKVSESESATAIAHSFNHIESVIFDTAQTQDAMGSVCLELLSLAGSDAVALYLPGYADTSLILASRQPLEAKHTLQLTHTVGQRFTRLAHLPVQLPDQPHVLVAANSPPAGQLPAFVEMLCVPLLIEHQVKGVLCAAFTTSAARAGCQASTLFHLANHAMRIYQEVWRARNMAARDLLTGLYNRSMFAESLKQLFSMAQRKGTQIGLLLFDVDNLKSVNDQFGHLVGDKLLREVAGLTLVTARTSDIVARFGGDEFIIILPETSLQDVQRAATRLLSAFRDRQFCTPGHHLHITLSIGIAAMSPNADSNSQTLLAQADEGLLAAKRSGKNRFCGAPSVTGDSPPDEIVPAVTAAATNGRVLILDDESSVRQLFVGMLRMMQYVPVSCATLQEALQTIENAAEDFDIVLTDLRLGNGNGMDLLQVLKEKSPWTVKMVVSAYASKATAIECLRYGAFDFIEKPFTYAQLEAAMNRAMEHRRLLVANRRYQTQLEDLVRSRSDSLSHALETLRRSYSHTIQTLALMIGAREANTGMHCRMAREAARLLARQMNISHHNLETIEMGAVLHDIGKLGIPDAILLKPGALLPEEWNIMKRHAKIGYDLLIGVPFLHDVAEIVLQHHEYYDGSGYPAGLKGEQICIGARVFSIIDAYHAMRSHRCYRPALSEDAAYREIVRCSGKQFDPAVVSAFLLCRPEIETAFALAEEH